MEHFPSAPADLVEVMREPFKAQQGFSYGKDTWKRWLAGIPGALEALDSLQEPIDQYRGCFHCRHGVGLR